MKKIIAMLIFNFALVLALSSSANSAMPLQRILREAENLSLNHDRILASNVLQRNLKKASTADTPVLREKLLQLSKLFYTDEGFRAHLSGKELFAQQKYADALEKFQEADELEKGNTDVLHMLIISQVQLKKTALALVEHKRAIQMCPIDIELQKDYLMILVAQEKWKEAIEQADLLAKEYNDTSTQTQKDRGHALYELTLKHDAKKAFEGAVHKDPRFPEPYYYLSLIKEKIEAQKLLTKYVNLCKDKSSMKYERELNLCSKQLEAEKRLAP
ncbi:MAG: hypothetical protein SGI74_07045 [Oligoflexia bacterium]|nr:hypothetical protein [Oligoflexia bacterium]